MPPLEIVLLCGLCFVIGVIAGAWLQQNFGRLT